jgi:hypothetical protein
MPADCPTKAAWPKKLRIDFMSCYFGFGADVVIRDKVVSRN